MGHVLDLTRYIRAGDTVVWGQSHAEPRTLIRALIAQRHHIGRIRLFLGIGLGGDLAPAHADSFDFISYCGSGTNRALAQAGVLDILPAHYSALPKLLSEGPLSVDVLMLQVSLPDEQGRYSLGMAREYLLPAIASARVIIGEVNPDVPWTFGGPYLTEQDFAAIIQSDVPSVGERSTTIGELERAIGQNVAKLIEDAATLQVGIGGIPDAVLEQLCDRKNLGVHSGGIGEGIMKLCEAGAITNSQKSIDRGLIITGSLMGGPKLRKFAHLNESLEMRGADYTHAASVLANFDNLVALNSAIEVDLTGQVNCETVGGTYLGAVGGIVDFLRAAGAGKRGLPIIAMPSTGRNQSRIVPRIIGPVTVPRSDPCIVVTEFGVADLRGKSLRQRSRTLIEVAHPECREDLEREAHALFFAETNTRS